MPGDSSLDGLEPDPAASSAVNTAVSGALTPLDRSFPVALCRAGADLARGERPAGTDALETAVAALEAYVTLRERVLHDATRPAGDRDVAILASDYLYARSHAALADGSLEEGRHLELSRLLTGGSCRLARSFLPSGEATPEDRRRDSRSRDGARPAAVLAGVAGELGAVTAGVPVDAAAAMDGYGRGLETAISAAGRREDGRRRSDVIRALAADASPEGRPRNGAADEPHGGRTRAALAELESVGDGAIDRETIGRLKYASVVAVRHEER